MYSVLLASDGVWGRNITGKGNRNDGGVGVAILEGEVVPESLSEGA